MIKATLLPEDLTFIFDGFNGSNFSATTVSLISIIIFTILENHIHTFSLKVSIVVKPV